MRPNRSRYFCQSRWLVVYWDDFAHGAHGWFRVGTGAHLFFNILTLGDRIPSVIYSRDMRLVFILVTVYTSLVGHFRQAANQETDEDINGGMNFKVNSEFLNHSIFGGVSDWILWNCRVDSRTNYYYKSLYGGLFFLIS